MHCSRGGDIPLRRVAFLIGHLFYIVLWLRAGIGIGAALKQPPRLAGAIALIVGCIAMTYVLVPRDNPMFAPLAVYTGVLTLMALCSFTLPWERLVMAGAVLFFISDGFSRLEHVPPRSRRNPRLLAQLCRLDDPLGWPSSDLFRRHRIA